ncbi:MAG: hypothetical protein MUC98_06545 [Desulfobacterota bacterium]|jgi:hypothetical protein|nr:hypothetical protein [Thermodesulfobacteriota bacterium]
MKMEKWFLRSFRLLACLLFLVQVYSVHAAEGDLYPVGSQINPFTVGVPDSPEVQKYLGLKSSDPFKLTDIGAKMVVIEFMNAL